MAIIRFALHAPCPFFVGIVPSDRFELPVLPVRSPTMRPPPIFVRFYIAPPANPGGLARNAFGIDQTGLIPLLVCSWLLFLSIVLHRTLRRDNYLYQV